MSLLYTYLKKYWRLCLAVLALAIVNQVFSLLDPLIFRHIIDDYASKPALYTSTQFFHGVGALLALAIGIVFVSRVAKNFQDYVLNMVIQRSGADMYQDGVRHSLELPYEVFEDQRSGETLGLLQKARLDAEKYLTLLINVVFIAIVGFIFVSIYAATLYWGVAVAYALTIPIIGGASYALTKKVKQVQKSIVAETTALAGATTESLRNIELVKSLGLADQEIARLNATTDTILQLELKKLRYVRSISFVQGTMINLMRNAILLFLLYLVFRQTITFGEFFSLYFYSFFIFGPLQEIGTVITAYREAEVSLASFEKVMSTPIEKTPEYPKALGTVETLAFNNVSFQYASAPQPSLHGISFSVTRGQTIAFVGPSGAGKTSLVKLLVGLYQPVSGTISYNGLASTDIALTTLRSQIGLVTQDTQLFAGSIRDNLLFVKPDATNEEMMAALEQSACEGLLARAGDGLATRIGEGGVKISGGERQRLSIARALLRKPTLLVFDEATSALDSLTEEEITATIRKLSFLSNTHQTMAPMTLLIAHRLSTVMHADCIYVLEKGRIVEQGTHALLVAQKGLYYAMWRQQVGE